MLYTIGYRKSYDAGLAEGPIYKMGRVAADDAKDRGIFLPAADYGGGAAFETKEQAFAFLHGPELSQYQDGASADDYAVYALNDDPENTVQVEGEPFRRLLYNARVIARVEEDQAAFMARILASLSVQRAGVNYPDMLDWLRVSPQNFARRNYWAANVLIYWVHESEFATNRAPLTILLGAHVLVRYQGHVDTIDLLAQPPTASVYKGSIEAIAAEDWLLLTKIK